jgi:hypothetical protein
MGKVFIPMGMVNFTADALSEMTKNEKQLAIGRGKITLERVDGGIIITDKLPLDKQTIELSLKYLKGLQEQEDK